MPSTGFSINNQFGAQTGPIQLDQLDSNFDELAAIGNALATYSNYFLDLSGSADAITVTVPSPLDPSLATGVQFQVKIAHTNLTTAPTMTVNALGTKAIVNADGSAPFIGQFVIGGIYDFIYNGTAFQVIGSSSASIVVTGSYTGTWSSGFTTTPSTSFSYVKVGPMAMIQIPAALLVSNAANYEISGAPSILRPTNPAYSAIPVPATNNGLAVTDVCAAMNAAGVIQYAKGGSLSGWTNSGNKGLNLTHILSYYVN